ncbi:MAG: hypothetical protein PVI30_17950 [Myxococcales bacterium]|jgi:hypothetical protein
MDSLLEWITQRAQPDLDWSYALLTLVFRFFAVFAVLGLIQAAMHLATRVIRRLDPPPPERRDPVDRKGAPDAETLAAIALALELEHGERPVRVAERGGTSVWAQAGRARQMRGRG